MRLSLLSTLLVVLSLNACAQATFPYSTENKKAIKLFEQAQQAPTAQRNPQTGAPNYDAGIVFLDQALSKDSNFWEAALLKAEFLDYQRKYTEAAKYYQRALNIDPSHSISGSTYFYLAACLITIGEYDEALKNINRFLQNPNAKENLINQAYQMRACAEFSINAMSQPVEFKPVNAGEGINTILPEYYPTLTVDGQVLLFTRRLPMSEPLDEQEDFYVSQFDDKTKTWKPAKAMPPNINTSWNEGAPTISGDGKKIIFVACTDNSGVNYGANRTGKGSCDLFITEKIGNQWTNPINLPGGVNTSNWETQPSLSADGKTLYFIRAIRSREGRSNSDIYVSELQSNGLWSEATRLSNTINSSQNEESVQIHPDGKTLYFASRGHIGLGGSDLFVSQLNEQGQWSKPVNLGYPINTRFDENSLLVSAQGNIAFFASDREGGYGKLDIYWFNLPESLQATKTFYFEGLAFDAVTTQKLQANVQLTDLTSGKEVYNGQTDIQDGKIVLPLPINRSYAVLVNKQGYLPFSLNFDLTLKENAQSYHLEMPLNPISSKVENVLNNVFFDLAKATLRPESRIELMNLANYLKANPSLKIEVQGHTDSQGDAQKNMILSEQRAKAVYDFLLKEGITAERINYRGFGSLKPVITDVQIAALTTDAQKAAAHQKNRRTTYTIMP
jgi:outer membrane protein OmpA-like peptidoglycan-associated protein/tetratricopeptide (TPR) repeat protein